MINSQHFMITCPRYLQVLKEISYSPMMAENLSFMNSKSSAYVWQRYQVKAEADENFAREIMQLFR